MYVILLVVLTITSLAAGQPIKCDQTPPLATVLTPSENEGTFQLTIDTKSTDSNIYHPDQTYVLILETKNQTRPFRWFMITVEDPNIENSTSELERRSSNVGSLKTLDTNRQSMYSERCYNSVENVDSSEKNKVEIHWVSPKQNDNKRQTVRLRAMVAENGEVWYTGKYLTITLDRDDQKPLDSPPELPMETCNLCSEARYEVIFKGHWSRMSHPRHYPSKPDDNGYSHMIGASHSYQYILWQRGDKANAALKKLAEEADISIVERDIIDAMTLWNGTRTLIRGKSHYHPHMFEPSYSLFRVDKVYHLFSILVAMKPSPDWFLGTSQFELCTDSGWLEESEIPLYPWDAGTKDGISYESVTSVRAVPNPVDRVEVGSFNKESPFYQMNLNDLKPFAYLKVKRLDVYPTADDDCQKDSNDALMEPQRANLRDGENEEKISSSEDYTNTMYEPQFQALRSNSEDTVSCGPGEWGEWSECIPDSGTCGFGTQKRSRQKTNKKYSHETRSKVAESCQRSLGVKEQSQNCFVEC